MVEVSQFLDIWVMESEQFKSNYTTLHYITLKPLFKKLVRARKRGELQNKITNVEMQISRCQYAHLPY